MAANNRGTRGNRGSDGHHEQQTSERSASKEGGAGHNKGPREMSEQDIQEHAWVDDWLRSQPGSPYTSSEWKNHFFKLSTTLSYILRHGAESQGLQLRQDGYISVSTLLAHKKFRDYARQEVEKAVEMNAKQRFALKTEGDVLLIRAQQGHSSKVGNIDQDALTTPIDASTVPEMVIHGTYWSNLKPILKEGLKTMERDHIHMAAGLPGDDHVKSGIRKESDTILKINVKKALADGIEFVRSGNGVILTHGRDGVLSPEYIECVLDRRGNWVQDVNPSSAQAKSASKARWNNSTSAKVAKDAPPSSAASAPSSRPEAGYTSSANIASASAVPPPSERAPTEKEFLKAAKKVRDILKLKKQKEAGKEKLAKNQEDKIAKLDEALMELAEARQRLVQDSELIANNKDILDLAGASA